MGYVLPSGVVNTNSAYFYANSLFVLGPYVKQLGDQTLIVIDYSKLTPPVVMQGFTFNVDVSSNPALVISYPQVSVTGLVLTFLLSGGIEGQQYDITITSTPSGRADTLTVNIPSSGCGCSTVTPVPALYTQLPLGSQGYVNSAVRFFWGNVPPTNPNAMDQWYYTASGILYQWVTDGTSYFWEALSSDETLTDAPVGNTLYGRYNAAWVPVPIQADAATNGNLYGRQNGAWAQAYPVGNPSGYQTAAQVAASISASAYVLPPATTTLLGGVKPDGLTITAVNGVISSSSGGITDAPANGSTYGRNNNAWVAVSGGSGGGIPEAPTDGQLYGRASASWVVVPAGGSGGIADAPNDGTGYQRKNAAWVHITHNDITDWSTALSGYALSSNIPSGSSAAPIADGVAAAGVSVAWSRGDHVHPSDPSRAPLVSPAFSGAPTTTSPASNDSSSRLANTAWVQNNLPPPSTVAPLMDGTAAVGTSTYYTRQDHKHPSDTSRYAATNPAGYQTAAQVTASIGAAAYSLPTATTSVLGGVMVDGSTITISGGVISSTGGAAPSLSVPAMDGTAAIGVSTTYARGDHVHPTDTSRAPLASPVFSGAPSLPTGAIAVTQTTGNSSTALATTAFVAAAVTSIAVPAPSTTTPAMDGTAAVGVGTTYTRADHVHPSDTTKANIIGVTNASNAAAGQVGEWISAQQLTAQNLTTATAINLATLSLTAGDWDVDGDVFYQASALAVSNFVCGVCLTSLTIPAVGTPGRAQIVGAATAFVQSSFSTGRLRVNVSTTTTVYLVASATFGSGTCTAQGTIQARRMR